jgi:hypothetical protein
MPADLAVRKEEYTTWLTPSFEVHVADLARRQAEQL